MLPPCFELEAVSKDKKKWKSLKINQETAKELTSGVYSFAQLKQIVEIILNNSQFKNETDLSAHLTQVKLYILITIKIQEKFGSREISIPFDLQDVDDIRMLRKLLEEKDKEIESLNKRLEETSKIASMALEKVDVLSRSLASRTPIIVRHEKSEEQEFAVTWLVKKQPHRVDVCPIVLPEGEWLVQYRYEFSASGASSVVIPFTICYGEKKLIENGYESPSGPRIKNDFVVVLSNGKDQLFVKLFDGGQSNNDFDLVKQQIGFCSIILCCIPV